MSPPLIVSWTGVIEHAAVGNSLQVWPGKTDDAPWGVEGPGRFAGH